MKDIIENKVKLGKYKHYKKGDMSEVFGIALHSETKEEFVLYRHLTGEHAGETNYWVRPVKMFLENVEVNGKKVPRFEYIGE